MTYTFIFAGPAHAQIETLVMPGKVIEGHAEYEEDCNACHAKFKRAEQRTLCLDCHEDVAVDVNAATGFHGRFDNAREAGCASCHTDHEGRDADIVKLDEGAFDHDFTDFALLGKHGETECAECHEAGDHHYAPVGAAAFDLGGQQHGDIRKIDRIGCKGTHIFNLVIPGLQYFN